MTAPQRPAAVSRRAFAKRSAPAEERFWSRVSRGADADCWLWRGTLLYGYGRWTNATYTSDVAHRIAYEILVGPIPEGLELDHVCRVRACVNPAHLEPVAHRENSRRSPLILKDSCGAGHEYVEGSYYLDRGRRACKECKIEAVREYTERTGRSKASYVCEFCGETRNATYRSKHLKRVHPEHYAPRKPSEGITPERHARNLANQRARRRRNAAEKGWM